MIGRPALYILRIPYNFVDHDTLLTDVLLEPGHAVAAAGDPRAPAEAEQGRRRDEPLLPGGRRQQLHRGIGGGRGVHGLPARQQGRRSRRLRGPPGTKTQILNTLVSKFLIFVIFVSIHDPLMKKRRYLNAICFDVNKPS